MELYKIGRNTMQGLKSALMAGVCASVLSGTAFAQVGGPEAPLKMKSDYLGYSAAVSTRFTYSDNLDLRRDGLKDDEYILSTILTGGAIISTKRLTALVMGDLDFSYLIDRSDFLVNQNIGATATATVAENLAYVDVSAQTSRQLVGDNARFSRSLNNARNQQANVNSFSASPYIYHQMADKSSVEVRYRFSQVFIDDSRTAASTFRRSFLNDSMTHEAFASYQTGSALERVRIRASAYANSTKETGSGILPDFEYQQGALYTDLRFAVDDNFSLSGAVGYDEVDTDAAAALFFNDDALSGAFWRAGFTVQPNRRGSARIEYGKRYGGDFIDADINYRLTRRLVFSANAGRTFQTRAQGNNSQFKSVQTQTLDFADQLRDGDEASPRNVINAANRFSRSLSSRSAQTVGVSVTDRANASISAVYDRTDVTLSAYGSDSNFGFRQIKTYGMSLSARHRLSRRITGYGNFRFRRSDTTVDTAICEANPVIFGLDTTDILFNPIADCAGVAGNNGITNTAIGRLGGSYRLYKNVSAYAEASYTTRFAPINTLEYDETSILVGATLEF
jgi:uncharacterized protein (PEP-CTERM system associated)